MMAANQNPKGVEQVHKSLTDLSDPSPEHNSQRIAVFLSDEAQKAVESDNGAFTNILEKAMPGAGHNAQIGPLINSLSPEEVDEMVQRAARMDASYKPLNFRKWHLVRPDTSAVATKAGNSFIDTPNPVQHLAQSLHALPEVESACHLQEAPAPAFNPNDDPLSFMQGYVEAAPRGIDARYAWEFAGGTGSGVGFVEMEAGNGGWNLEHEDLVNANIKQISGFNSGDKSHGTGVLGIVLMTDNQVGGIGLASNAHGFVISQSQAGGINGPDAIIQAANAMDFGSVLLLEAQAVGAAGSSAAGRAIPLEAEDPTFDAIRLATALGITVIEPAANDGVNLDTYKSSGGKFQFNRSSPDFKESNAIVVGAGSSTIPHSRLGFSSFGSRVDLYAWGENVQTCTTNATGTENKQYTSNFSGTSSASSIIAGAALIIQGIVQTRQDRTGTNLVNPVLRYNPTDLRRILQSDGTPTGSPNDLIGVMPNLRSIINGPFFQNPPDMYIRTEVGSVSRGGPGLSASPDIIVRTNIIADPQATFGLASGNATSSTLSQDIVPGRDHFVYVRVLNRGGIDAKDVTVRVYASPASTFTVPEPSTLIGETTIPLIRRGNVLTVSPGIKWDSRHIAVDPQTHYCLTAIIDVQPYNLPDVDVFSFDTYVDSVQAISSIAFSNFEIISAPPSSSENLGYHRLPFIFPGAFNSVRVFSLKYFSSLPQGSDVKLRVPQAMVKDWTIEKGVPVGDMLELSLNSSHPWELGTGTLEEGSRSQCEVLIKVPADTYSREGVWELAVIQLAQFKGEIGRLTWHFGQRTQVVEV